MQMWPITKLMSMFTYSMLQLELWECTCGLLWLLYNINRDINRADTQLHPNFDKINDRKLML